MRICITCDGISATDAERCAHCGGALLERESVHVPIRRGEAESAHPLIGSTVGGKYEIRGVLGRGGMGIVFRAVHTVSLVQVALKLLHRRLALRQEYRDWFLAEARKAGRVSHEHCARIQDVGTAEDGSVFIAMELAQGPPLSAWLVEKRPIDSRTVVEVLVQMTRAIVAAHEVGVVHRDLSPRNVVIAVRDGMPFVKILDFGIARGMPDRVPKGGGDDESLAAPAGFANPAYAAPEVLAGGESGPRADLYSLGVIAYHMCVGELPVEGDSPQRLADATLAGRVGRLTSSTRVPARLARLVNRLLEHDPDARPASAQEVLAELAKIRSTSGSNVLRGVAVFAATAGIGLSAAAFSTATPRYVSAPPRSPVAFSASPNGTPVQALRSSSLHALRFDFGGFDPAELEFVVSAPGRDPETYGVSPRVRGSEFALTVDDPDYSNVIGLVAEYSRAGPVDLVLQVAGLPPLAFASVRVDDDPPTVALEVEGDLARSEALVGGTRFRFEVRDAGELAASCIVMRAASSVSRFPTTRAAFDARAMFGSAFPGFEDLGPVELHAEAVDTAGNVGRSESLEFAHFDLRAPEIRSVPKVVTFDGAGASVRIVLDAEEAGLAVAVRGPHGPVPVRSARGLGDRIDVVLGGTNREFPDGTYRIRLEDTWGNFSREYAEEWRFVASDPGLVFKVAGGRSVKWRDGIYCDGSAFELALECSEAYRVNGVSVDQPDGSSRAVPVTRTDAARFRVEVPELGGGDCRMRIDLGAVGAFEAEAEIASIELVVRPKAPTVRIPGVGDARFLGELIGAAVLRREDDGTLSAADWVWDVADRRMLSGRIWIGSDDALTPREFVPPSTAQGPVVQRVPLKRGINVLGLELVDPLGRPVDVRHGDRAAPRCRQIVDRDVRQVARFWYDAAPCRALEPEVLVEHGQPVDLVLGCEVPLTPRDPVHLLMGRTEFEPIARDGSRFEFRVPFEVVASAGGFVGVAERAFRSHPKVAVTVRVVTPAGGFDVDLQLAPVLTSLVPVELGSLFRGSSDAIAGLRFVPVLGVERHPDPVPPDLGARAVFRALPPGEVRNIADVFLQDAEFTRGQYASVVAQALALVGHPTEEVVDRLVHVADPDRRDRLTRVGMVPRTLEKDVARWEELCRIGPDRPVTGVCFYQAYTAIRLLGLVVAGEPDLFRLPLGVELEAAALGGLATDGIALNAARSLDVDAFRRAGRDGFDAASWPPTAAECELLGDFVSTQLGHRITGIDFGVREWVGDLPFSAGVRGFELMREWLSDHTRHLQQIADLASSSADDEILSSTHFARVGVVRGLAYGESRDLIDGRSGLAVHERFVPPSVPGVVRCHNMLRDGRQPASSSLDPRLERTGFRVCGGANFVERMRSSR